MSDTTLKFITLDNLRHYNDKIVDTVVSEVKASALGEVGGEIKTATDDDVKEVLNKYFSLNGGI